jgi:prophage antirepressor-like protein
MIMKEIEEAEQRMARMNEVSMNEVSIRVADGSEHLVFFGEHRVQTITRSGDLWFLALDLGRMLELGNVRDSLRQLKNDEKDWCYMEPHEPWPTAEEVFRADKTGVAVSKTYSNPLSGRRLRWQKVRVVNEAGLYRLIFMSRTPSAKAFQDWVVREVLPAIRKTGKYKQRRTTPPVFAPKDMPGVQQVRITVRERYRHLEWIAPHTPA